MANDLIIYGSYGYTGELITKLALERGLKPVLAGRNAEKVQAQATELGLEARVFGLDHPVDVDTGLAGMTAVIHCAGPFAHTAKAMAEGCLRNKVHYLDITGEIEVFEQMAALDARAQDAGVMLMPGTGFDVVPSDCLALHLKEQLPSATHLSLAFHSTGSPSHGTASTMVEGIAQGGAIRRDGKIESVPGAYKVRDIDFGEKTKTCMTIPWGDVSTAWYSTGIPNIEVYMSAPGGLRAFAKISRFLGGLLASGPVQNFLKNQIPEGGPDENELNSGYCLLWGEVRDGQGNTAEARLKTRQGYNLTADTSVNIAQKVLGGNAPTGFQTPAKAYGADLILEADGVERW